METSQTSLAGGAQEITIRLASLLLPWYRKNARVLPWRKNTDPYRVWVSEIMLQQTRVEAVIPYYNRFMEALPTVQDLAQAEEPLLHKLWEGLGYYSRVRNLQKAARMVMEEYDGVIPGDFQQLLRLPGIGEYTAGAIASIAFGIAVPAVDGNVLRVFSRLLDFSGDVSDTKVKKQLTALAAASVPTDSPGDYNQSLMELGATVCLPNTAPKCLLCPARCLCRGCAAGTAERLPVKKEKKPRVIDEKTVLVILYGGRVLLRQRPEKGLLAGLWELPSLPGHLSLEEVEAWAASKGFCLEALFPLKPSKHIFTHREWRMEAYLLRAQAVPSLPEWVWANGREIREKYALPGAFKAYTPFLEEWMEV